jgi:hypothetical protein
MTGSLGEYSTKELASQMFIWLFGIYTMLFIFEQRLGCNLTTGIPQMSFYLPGYTNTKPDNRSLFLFRPTTFLFINVKIYSLKSRDSVPLKRSDLVRHTRGHTGVRNFSCKICYKSFTRNNTLLEHINRYYKQDNCNLLDMPLFFRLKFYIEP